MKKFTQFLAFVQNSRHIQDGMREGQFLFFCLDSFDKKLATAITGSDDDPFYQDSRERLAAFYTRLLHEWTQ